MNAAAPPAVAPDPDYHALYLAAQRRFERERRARQQAETIAEEGLRTLHQRERHAALLATIARHANGSSTQVEALQGALSEICDHTGWVCGFAYFPDEAAERRLVLSACWLAVGEGLDAFIQATQTARFPLRHGLPGRVDATRQAAWIRDVAEDDNFPRKCEAIACGLRAGIAFPILVEGEVAVVIEFFAREALDADALFLTVLETVGTQLGRVVERERTRAQLVYDATHDALTGLPNRALFHERLASRIVAEADAGALPFAVLFIDLDRFKLVNDSLGHRAGDALLVTIARRFARALERSGIAHLLARLGGDEFVVLLDRVAATAQAIRVAEELLAALACPIALEGQSLYGSASIGVTCSTLGYASAADVMRDADLAMYEAKHKGKARVALFEPNLHLQAVTRLAVESDLRHALSEGQFVLHYQPIVALGTNHPIGFEALVRWQKAPGVLIPPAAFIGIAEETGLIVFLGDHVLQQACRTVARWNADRAEGDALFVAVNVSARQFQQPNFVQSVERAIAHAGARASFLRLELTESVAIANVARTVEILDALRARGVRVSIDDFGTGHSSLAYLHQLAFDTIKIDRSFVQAMDDATDGGHIVRTILDLARNLNVSVVAEGAETAEHMAKLERLGCPYVQGYFVSRPLNEDAATIWLSEAIPRVA